jgi:hypothetical protein
MTGAGASRACVIAWVVESPIVGFLAALLPRVIERGLMLEQRYRLKVPTLAIMRQNDLPITVMVPLGGIVHVTADALDENRLVDVEWKGKTLKMFTLDIYQRGELVERQGTKAKHIDD